MSNKKKIIVIPDTQCRPGVDLSYMSAIDNSTIEKRLEKIAKEALADAVNNYLGPAHIVDTVIAMIKKDGLLKDE